MSEERLQSLINQYPAYSEIFRAVYNWFITHPKQRDVSLEVFYNSKVGFSRTDLNIAFSIMKRYSFIKSVYRIVDNDGTKVGGEYYNVDDIPTHVDLMWGEKKHIDDMFIIPFYSLNQ